jgi:hypothetical protein
MLLERPDGLELIVPAKRNFFMMVFLLAWVTGWAFGEVTTISEPQSGNILSGNTKGALPFVDACRPRADRPATPPPRDSA